MTTRDLRTPGDAPELELGAQGCSKLPIPSRFILEGGPAKLVFLGGGGTAPRRLLGPGLAGLASAGCRHHGTRAPPGCALFLERARLFPRGHRTSARDSRGGRVRLVDATLPVWLGGAPRGILYAVTILNGDIKGMEMPVLWEQAIGLGNWGVMKFRESLGFRSSSSHCYIRGQRELVDEEHVYKAGCPPVPHQGPTHHRTQQYKHHTAP